MTILERITYSMVAAAKAEAFDGEIDLTGAFRRQIVEKAREAAGAASGGDEGFEDDEAEKW